jgi:hypothetical protein
MSHEPPNLERLDYWVEIIGPYRGCYRIENLVCFKIGNKTIAFDRDSRETEILRSKLKDEYIDYTVGILRTDSLEVPLVVRLIKGE